MASITMRQTQSLQPGNLFRVLDEITASTDISSSVFVFTTETQAFSRVATVYDVENLLYTSYAEAFAHAAEYYRLTSVQMDFEEQTKAEAFAAYTQARVRTLANDYTEYTSGFAGVTTYTYTGV